MKFETKAIHGVRNNGEKVEEWGSTINMASDNGVWCGARV